MKHPKDTQTIVTNYFSKNDNIQLVFLFGSIVAGHHSETSDIDLAILFQAEPDFYRLDDIKNALFRLVKREIDIVILNDASPIIKMQVLKNGIPLIRKGGAYEEFFTRTVEELSLIHI